MHRECGRFNPHPPRSPNDWSGVELHDTIGFQRKGQHDMKTATLFLTALTLTTAPAFSQAAGGYAGAAAASQTTAAATGQALGKATQTAVTQSANGTAAATAKPDSVTGAAGAASSTAARTDGATLSAAKASSFSAELTRRLDSKNAKVGDEVIARTTSTAQLAGGERLPKGTKLIGKVTEVRPRSAEHDGHLAFAFSRAVLRGGREIPIHAALDSISAPVDVAAMAGGSDDFGATAGPVGAAGGAGVSGGLLGGAHTSGLVGGATSAVAGTTGAVVRNTRAVAHTTGAAAHQTAGLVSQTAGSTFGAVSYLPGVTATSSASSTTILDAKGSNVELSNGTELMLTAAVQ